MVAARVCALLLLATACYGALQGPAREYVWHVQGARQSSGRSPVRAAPAIVAQAAAMMVKRMAKKRNANARGKLQARCANGAQIWALGGSKGARDHAGATCVRMFEELGMWKAVVKASVRAAVAVQIAWDGSVWCIHIALPRKKKREGKCRPTRQWIGKLPTSQVRKYRALQKLRLVEATHARGRRKSGKKYPKRKRSSNNRKPQNARNNRKTQNGGNSRKPHRKSNTRKPQRKRNSYKPRRNRNARKPQSNRNTRKSKSNRNTRKPQGNQRKTKNSKTSKQTESRSNNRKPRSETEPRKPNKGRNTRTPNKGRNTRKPYKRRNTRKPNKGRNTRKPNNGSNTRKPNKGRNKRTSNKGRNKRTRNKGRNKKSPDKGRKSRNQSKNNKPKRTASAAPPRHKFRNKRLILDMGVQKYQLALKCERNSCFYCELPALKRCLSPEFSVSLDSDAMR